LYRIPFFYLAALAAISQAQAESGKASYYGGVGRSGEMTCAHRTRPMGSMVTVSYQGRSIRCRVNDRGPFVKGRVIDVSLGAAKALGMIDAGVVMVSLGH
jgi:rare lipoprotein A